jgi:phosphocarrier protein
MPDAPPSPDRPPPDVEAELTIANQRGLHARAAAKFVKLAGQFEAEVEVGRGDQSVDGRSIMGLMMLAAAPGTTIRLAARGPQAKEAVVALSDLVRRKFDED